MPLMERQLSISIMKQLQDARERPGPREPWESRKKKKKNT